MRRAARPAVAAFTALALAAPALAGCGGDPVPEQSFGKRLQSATCSDWKESTPQQRQSAVDQLEHVVAGPLDEGNTLPDDVAYATLDGRCEEHYARGFLLYELYIRAAGFESVSE